METFTLRHCIDAFRSQKAMAERAIAQLDDQQLQTALDPATNSVAVIIKHVSGNMISRWTDVLTTDGDKPDRDRDGEFVDTFTSRAEVMACWERGWACLFNTLESLLDEDLPRQITIRGQPETLLSAILRQVGHYGYHLGQIILIARILVGDRWQVLTIPRGGSAAYNDRLRDDAPNRT